MVAITIFIIIFIFKHFDHDFNLQSNFIVGVNQTEVSV